MIVGIMYDDSSSTAGVVRVCPRHAQRLAAGLNENIDLISKPMRKLFLSFAFCLAVVLAQASPITGLLERIDPGASGKFKIELQRGDTDFFELDQAGSRVVVRGNNYVSIATGINWYLKYYAGIHLSWNGMKAKLPAVLPPVTQKERHETLLQDRYYLNYCTHSYSMAFWDWARWEQEIDWMALHGINLPLALVGTDTAWRNVLLKLGYTKEEANAFVAGPAFQAWWLMNNLEGWGGPNSDQWYEDRVALQKKILKRMREYGIRPVLPGYSGMLPHDAKEKLGVNVTDPGLWNGFHRPAFLQPTDERFQEIASLYYKEMNRLFGKVDYYSMDPFHEGGSVKGVDLEATGRAIWQAMKKANPKAAWVVQAWGANPRPQMLKGVPQGDMLVLDLYSENRPQWGDPASTWYRKNGFDGHDWVYCMLLNFGGNVGLFGKMAHVIDEFYKAKESPFGSTLRGVGLTPEGIENNPVMYELVTELPWRETRFSKDEWLAGYLKARYGKADARVQEAWILLSNTIYACPDESTQQGEHESVLCARPSLQAYQVSTWAEMSDYYEPMDIIRAAGILLEHAEAFRGNNNFEYDLVDVVRQAVSEKGRLVYPVVVSAFKAGDKELFAAASRRFLDLILLQDKLLATRPEFKVGRWIAQARALGHTPEEQDHYEWNARVQVTTWGNRVTADDGGLHDYAYKEWNGLLRDFYYMRWKTYFDGLARQLEGEAPQAIDFYALEEAWTLRRNAYSAEPEGDVLDTAREVYEEIAR